MPSIEIVERAIFVIINYMQFEQPDENFLSEYNKELKNPIIKCNGVHCYIKIRENSKTKEFIAAKLASFLDLNAVEVIYINDDDLDSLKKVQSTLTNAAEENTYLVRLGQSYSIDEMPIKNLDEAVASELIFSMWVRRRDTHLDNRVYIESMPLFYDFHVAFDKNLRDINVFFNHGKREDGGYLDKGYVGSWRVKIIKDDNKLETLKIRQNDSENNKTFINYHFINDRVNLVEQLHKYSNKINILSQDKIKSQIEEWASEVNISNNKIVDDIIQLLINTKETIMDDVGVIEKNIFIS